MKNFDHVIEYVDAYLHDLLAPREIDYVEEHCKKCPVCEAALAEARKRHVALQTLPTVEASEELVRATVDAVEGAEELDRIQARKRRWAFGSVAAGLAAAVLLLAGLNLHYANLTPSPYDMVVLGQNNLLAGAPGSVRVRLLDRSTGRPQAGVPVALELRAKGGGQTVQLAQFHTDSQGSGQPRFRLPDWADGEYELRVVARPGGKTETLTQTVKLHRSWKLMLSTDKPVYQPGQEIHVRSLALRRPDLKPVAGQEVVFTITDPKSNIIYKQKGVTSKFGISSVDCATATELIEGPYTITCKVGDTESKQTVEVKKYVLPKFKIEVNDLERYYQPGQRVKGTVQVDYFFGQPVANAEVAIALKTIDVPGTGERPPDPIRTDASGKATFDLPLPKSLIGRPQDGGDARFALEVKVKDTAGQEQSRTVSRVVTSQPLRIEVVPESGTLVQDVANTIYVFVTQPDGEPAKKVRLAVAGIEKEIVTNDLGVAVFELTPKTAAPMELTVQATDGKGRIARRQVSLTAGQVPNDFLVRADKAVYSGGETVHLTALGAGVEPVFVDLIKDGQTMVTETVDLADGKGACDFDLPPDLFGTVELCAYRFNAEGLPVRKTRVLYIRPADQLKIEATPDQKEYRPHGKAKLVLTLTDGKGNPVPGALSLAAVDEAVFSVLEQAPGMEKTFYLLEQELLQPIYAIYSWYPDDVPNNDRNQLEQALFSRTARTLPVAVKEPPVQRPRGGARPRAIEPGEARPEPGAAPAAGGRSPHSLSVNSFPIKAEETQKTREAGLQGVKIGWITLASLAGLAGYLGLWFFQPTAMLWAHGGGVVVVIIGLAAMTFPGSKFENFDAVGVDRAMGMAEAAGDVRPMTKDMPKEFNPAQPPPGGGEPAAPVRVREHFPETLLWRPELITDEQGKYTLDLELADSITTWRLSASAVSADGRLGGTQQPVRVFQPFFVDLNLPVNLTKGDEVAVPVVVHNYQTKAQTVDLKLVAAPWFELLDEADKKIELGPRQVKAVSYRIRVDKVGLKQKLEVRAQGDGVADAIRKEIEVAPGGRRIEAVFAGNLDQPFQRGLSEPQGAIEGSTKLFVKLYPSTFSQLVEGLDGIFQMPSGCFEQTSSTLYPNVLALDYLRRTKKSAPEVEAKARQYIHVGYQRLLSFEVSGGGFDWFGNPPANRRLTAYGLMEFQDMAKVHDVDPKLIERTRDWLLRQRKSDGSWDEAGGLHQEADPARGQTGDRARFVTTAYIAWSVFGSQKAVAGRKAPTAVLDSIDPLLPEAGLTIGYLNRNQSAAEGDPYALALAANALLAMDPAGDAAKVFVEKLAALKKASPDGKLAWWEQGQNSRTAFYGAGNSASIETTALATLALIRSNQHPATTRAALGWIIKQKDPRGTWHSTQATVLALKALLAGTGASLGESKDRVVEITLGSDPRRITIPADQADVMQLIDLTDQLRPGVNDLKVVDQTGTGTTYQVVFRSHVPDDGFPEKGEALSIGMAYDKTELAVNDRVKATATVWAHQMAPMVILDLPVPAGFAVVTEDFDQLVRNNQIAKYQITPRKVIVYLRSLEPGKTFKLDYGLRATMPVKAVVPAARVYEYYDPSKQATSKEARVVVNSR